MTIIWYNNNTDPVHCPRTLLDASEPWTTRQDKAEECEGSIKQFLKQTPLTLIQLGWFGCGCLRCFRRVCKLSSTGLTPTVTAGNSVGLRFMVLWPPTLPPRCQSYRSFCSVLQRIYSIYIYIIHIEGCMRLIYVYREYEDQQAYHFRLYQMYSRIKLTSRCNAWHSVKGCFCGWSFASQ